MKTKIFILLFALVAGIGTATAEIYSGNCGAEVGGSNIQWTLNTEDSTLVINGTGEMRDFHFQSPWKSKASYVKSVTISDGITNIGHSAFQACIRLTSINIPNTITSIGDYAFSSCHYGLTSLIIPNSVVSIGDNAFSQCWNLSSISIGDSVTSIGAHAFTECRNLLSVTIPDNVLFLGMYAFNECRSMTSVNLGSGLTSIENCTFFSCSSIRSITIPDNVTEIGKWAFRKCGLLSSVIIGNGVTSIGEEAFSQCDFLATLVIHGSVSSIGRNAFMNCTQLSSVTCYATTPPAMSGGSSHWQDDVFCFVNCSKIPLFVPEESVEAYKAADQWKEFNPIVPIGTIIEALDHISIVNEPTKILHNGRILIFRGDKVYTITGQEVR